MEKVVSVKKVEEQHSVYKRVLRWRDLSTKKRKVVELRTIIRILNGVLQVQKRNKKHGQEEGTVHLVDEPGSKRGKISRPASIAWDEANKTVNYLKRIGFKVELKDDDSDCALVTRVSDTRWRHEKIYQMFVEVRYRDGIDTQVVRRELFKATKLLPRKEKRKAHKKKRP